MGRIKDFFFGADNSESQKTPDFSQYRSYDADISVDDDGTPYFLPESAITNAYVSRNTNPVTLDTAITIPAVYRAFDILSTAVSQLQLKVVRNGVQIDTPNIIAQPDSNQSLSQFLKRTVIGLAADGNAFWLLSRDVQGNVFNIEVLNPRLVQIQYDNKTGAKYFLYGNKKYNKSQIAHLRKLEVPGYDRGLGPIQACRGALKGSLDLTSYANNWFSDSGVPTGVLSTTSALNNDQALEAKQRWEALQTTRGVAVVGNGLSYTPILLNPADAQFLESQQFSVTDVARIFSIPAGLMLAEVNGNSMTYTNQEQSTLEFIRFGLMAYLKEIEDALSHILVRGQTVEFILEGLLRPDSKTRAEVQKLYLDMGALTINEVRAQEGLRDLTPAELEEAKPKPPVAPIPAEVPAND